MREAGIVGGDDPGRQARQARLGARQLRVLPIEPQLLLHRADVIAADEVAGLGDFFPDDALQRIAAPIRAHAVELAAVAALVLRRLPGRARRGRPRRQRCFGPRPGQRARRGLPHRPGTEQAEWVTRFDMQRRQRVRSAVRRHKGEVCRRLAAAGHIDEDFMAARQRIGVAQPDTMLRAARARQHHLQRHRLTGKSGGRRLQVQRHAAQRVVRHVHRHKTRAGEQEGQHVAEAQLIVDRGQQHDDEHGRERQAGARRQDVDVALRQQPGVGARQARLEPGLYALADAEHQTSD